MYEYYVALMYILGSETAFANACYKLNFKIDSIENMMAFTDILKKDGYKNPVILFFKQLGEKV